MVYPRERILVQLFRKFMCECYNIQLYLGALRD